MLEFRNHIAKPRRDRNKKDGELAVTPPIQIGNDIQNIEAMRFQLKTQVRSGFIPSYRRKSLYLLNIFQFDRNVVTHYHNQEQIFDFIFKHLSVKGEEQMVPHPVVLTECFANPNYSRQCNYST